MSVEDNKAAAVRMITAIGESDIATVASLMTPDATFWGLGQGDYENATPKDVFLKALPASLAALFAGPVRFTVQGVTAENDRVAIEATSDAVLVRGGRYNNRYHFLFIFEGGKIKFTREYNDTAYTAAALS